MQAEAGESVMGRLSSAVNLVGEGGGCLGRGWEGTSPGQGFFEFRKRVGTGLWQVPPPDEQRVVCSTRILNEIGWHLRRRGYNYSTN